MAMKYAGAKRDDAPPSFWIGTSEVQRYLPGSFRHDRCSS